MKKWEYNHIRLRPNLSPVEMNKELNAYGDIGWELIAYQSGLYVLRRPLDGRMNKGTKKTVIPTSSRALLGSHSAKQSDVPKTTKSKLKQ